MTSRGDSTTLPPPNVQRQPARPASAADNSVVLLDRVSGNAPTDHAPRRSESAAGGIVVVATGGDAERVRKLCHAHGLLVPVMASLAVVHEAMSIVVIGEPSPPAADRVVHVVRPALPDADLLELLRALAAGRVAVEPLPPPATPSPKAEEAARQLAALTDRLAIESAAVAAITTLTAADRAHCLFHDPITGALWSEARRRERGDDRHAMGGLVGWAAQTGRPLHASPAGDDPRWLCELDDPDGKPQSRLLVQPIVGADRRVHAVLVAVRRWRHADFTAAEIDALAAFAALAAPTLDLAVAAAPADSRTSRTTQAGPLGAASASALVAAPRTTGDSRPPPLTVRTGSDSKPPPTSATAPAASDDVPEAAAPASEGPADEAAPPSIEAGSPRPQRPARAATSDESAARPPRARTANDASPPRPRRITGEPRDLAVIANDADAKRVQRVAKRAHLELAVFSAIEDAPEVCQLVTVGEAWSPEANHRVAYAARSTILDDQLADLLCALTTGRAVTPAPPLVRPHSIAEARRAQLAFAGARTLAAATDLAAAEQAAIDTMRELLDTDRAYCLFVDAATGALWSETRRRASGDDRRAIAGIAGWAAHTGHAVSVPRASADPRWLGPIDDPDGDPHGQLLVQPLVHGDGRVLGVLIAVRRPRRPGFTEPDAALLARFAALVAPVVEHIAIAAETRKLLGDAPSARTEPTAPNARAQGPLAAGHPWSRWIFLAIGVLVGLLLGLLV